MKQRIITGVLLAVFVTPLIIFGQYLMASFIAVLAILGTYEFLNIKKKANQQEIPIYVYVISMLFALLLIFDILPISDCGFDFTTGILEKYSFNVLWIVSFAAVLFSCSVFDKRFSIIDSMYSFATTLFLSFGLKGMLYLRSVGGINNLVLGALVIAYILIVTCCTDIFAYFGGMTCYKLLGNEKVHKLNERISPKKTIEGSLIGTIFGTVLGFLFAYFLLDDLKISWYLLLIMSLLLSVFGQIGDLILSANKRYFNIKDYSKLLPGHGGVLDRIDSILINCMVAAIFIGFIL